MITRRAQDYTEMPSKEFEKKIKQNLEKWFESTVAYAGTSLADEYPYLWRAEGDEEHSIPDSDMAEKSVAQAIIDWVDERFPILSAMYSPEYFVIDGVREVYGEDAISISGGIVKIRTDLQDEIWEALKDFSQSQVWSEAEELLEQSIHEDIEEKMGYDGFFDKVFNNIQIGNVIRFKDQEAEVVDAEFDSKTWEWTYTVEYASGKRMKIEEKDIE